MLNDYRNVFWFDRFPERAFVILWADGTWEEFTLPVSDSEINGKSYKEFMEFRKCKSYTKREVYDHIDKKFKEMKEKSE